MTSPRASPEARGAALFADRLSLVLDLTATSRTRFVLTYAAMGILFGLFRLALSEDVTWLNALLSAVLFGGASAAIDVVAHRRGWGASWRISKNPDDYR